MKRSLFIFSFLILSFALHAGSGQALRKKKERAKIAMQNGDTAQDTIIKIQNRIDELKREGAGIDLATCNNIAAADPRKAECILLQARKTAIEAEIKENEGQLSELKGLPQAMTVISSLPTAVPPQQEVMPMPTTGNTGIVPPHISMPGTPSSVQSLVLPQPPVSPVPVEPLQQPVGEKMMEAKKLFEGGMGQPQPATQLPSQQERVERPLVSAGSPEPSPTITPPLPAITPAQQGAISATPFTTQPVMTEQGMVQPGTQAPPAVLPLPQGQPIMPLPLPGQ